MIKVYKKTSDFCKKKLYFLLFLLFIVFFILNNKSYSFDISTSKANTPMPTDTRIKTFVYNPNEIFQVKFLVGYQSIIELQKDEDVELITFGDASSFSTPRIIGRRIFLKVNEAGVKTNMTIITDKRTYLLEVMSNDDDGDTDDRITYILRFFYPDINIDTPPSEAKIAQIKLNSSIMAKANNNYIDNAFASSANINTEYSYSGKNKNLIPTIIFDNGKKTYFKFNSIDENNLPIISYLSQLKDNSYQEIPLLIKRNGDYLYVDTVEYYFTIRQGKDLVCIFNDGISKQKALSKASKK